VPLCPPAAVRSSSLSSSARPLPSTSAAAETTCCAWARLELQPSAVARVAAATTPQPSLLATHQGTTCGGGMLQAAFQCSQAGAQLRHLAATGREREHGQEGQHLVKRQWHDGTAILRGTGR